MINTDKIIDFYTDTFGNEVDVYEQVEKYTIAYKGHLFEGDKENGYNQHNYDKWEDAKAIYDAYPEMNISIRDNEYGVVFEDGDWN